MLEITDPLVAKWMQTLILGVPRTMDTPEGWRRMAASNSAVALALRIGAITVIGRDDSELLLDCLGETEAQAEAAVMSHPHYGQVFRRRVLDVPALRDLMEVEVKALTETADAPPVVINDPHGELWPWPGGSAPTLRQV